MVLKSGRVAEQPVPDIVNKTRISRLRDMGNSDGDGKVLVANGVNEFDFQTLSTQADHFDRPRVCAIGDEPDCRCRTLVFVTPQRVRLSDPNWPVLTKDAVLRQNRIGAEGLHGLHLGNVKRDN
jgi:hypothetical protein